MQIGRGTREMQMQIGRGTREMQMQHMRHARDALNRVVEEDCGRRGATGWGGKGRLRCAGKGQKMAEWIATRAIAAQRPAGRPGPAGRPVVFPSRHPFLHPCPHRMSCPAHSAPS
eukprot:274343-Chlamydomonas_euryale.AAC.1